MTIPPKATRRACSPPARSIARPLPGASLALSFALPRASLALCCASLGLLVPSAALADPDAGCIPAPEKCDCIDNDCDGVIDNVNDPALPDLCAPGKACVKEPLGCICAAPCTGENDCPAAFTCDLHAPSSQTGEDLGPRCIVRCDACEASESYGEDGYVECAPAGSHPELCLPRPVCVCKWPFGCQSPCFLVACPKGQACAEEGPAAGSCVPNDCDHVPCTGCTQICVEGVCVSDPCAADSCPPGALCVPDPDFQGFSCTPAGAGGATSTSTTSTASSATGGGAGAGGAGPSAFGGCGCRSSADSGPDGAQGGLLTLLALGWVRRRFPRRASSCSHAGMILQRFLLASSFAALLLAACGGSSTGGTTTTGTTGSGGAGTTTTGSGAGSTGSAGNTGTGGGTGGSGSGACPVFPADNAWNTDISGAPVDALSDTYVATIGIGVHAHPDFGDTFGIPFVDVDGSVAKSPVIFDDAPDESDVGPYPIPANPPIEQGSDAHLLMVHTGECKLYELYATHHESDGWHAGSGAIWDLKSNAMRPAGWTSADAAGLPIYPGLVRWEEAQSGEIKHAFRFTVPKTQRAYVAPASHFASSNTDPSLPPMGLRMRLKKDFDVSGYPQVAQVILTALKKYGMILADNGSAWYISGAPNPSWVNEELDSLKQLQGSDFEAVKTGPLVTQ